MLSAFFVVLLHTHTFGPEIFTLCDIGVPIFFMITGYFLPDNDGCFHTQRLKKTLLKILRIAITFQLLYFAVNTILSIMNGELAEYLHKFTETSFWVELLLFGYNINGPLWYLTAVMESVAIIWIATRLKLGRLLWIMIPVGLFINLLCNEFILLWGTPFTEYPSAIARNAINVGLPFLLIGAAIRRNQHRLPATWTLGIIALVSFALIFAELSILDRFAITHYCNLHISTIILSVACFAFCATTTAIAPTHNYSTLSTHAQNIYLYHMMIIDIATATIPFFSLLVSVKGPAVYVAALLLSMTIVKVKCRMNTPKTSAPKTI